MRRLHQDASPRSRRIVVFGAGYVGLITAVGLATRGHLVQLVETTADRLESLRAGQVPIHEPMVQEAFSNVRASHRLSLASAPTDRRADMVVICVGTPIDAAGQADLSQLRSALVAARPLLHRGACLVIRSTLPVGSTDRILGWANAPTSRIFTNPEFLRQGSALADFLKPTRVIIGRFPDANPASVRLVTGIFATNSAPLRMVTIEEADLIKNASNAFLAIRLSFVNELALLSERTGADIVKVLDGVGLDPRIGSAYMRPSYGYGGSCLPKDLRTLTNAGLELGLAMHMTSAALEANAAHPAAFANRIERELGGMRLRTIAMLGLAFKAGTDDLRDSPAIRLAELLMARGATIRAFDPCVTDRGRLPDGLSLAESAVDTIAGADAIVIATDWPEFRELDWSAMRRSFATRLIFDGRRLMDSDALTGLGYRVIALGAADLAASSSDDLAATG